MLDIIIVPFTNVLVFLYDILGNNFGLAIIAFTVLIKLLTYPLSVSQLKSARMTQELQSDPRWKQIQAKYKDNREKLAQEQMKFYQEKGISPFSSCLPSLIQFPLLIAMYWSIQRSLAATPLALLEFARGIALPNAAELMPLNSSFLWMDLSQPERLHLDFLPFAIPVLTVVVVITTWLQSKMMTPATADANDQSAQMARSMSLTMPLMMGYISMVFPSGLSIYYAVSNVFGIAQAWLMRRRPANAATTTK